MLNESPDGNTNDVFGEHMTTAFTGATRINDASFVSEISPKRTFFYNKSRFLSLCFQLGWNASDNAHYRKGFYKDYAICMA